jgi:ATP-dependent RNA helicase RhlE
MPAPSRKRGVVITPKQVTFADLDLPKPVQQALDEAGYTMPTPVQGLAIPPALEGRDVLGIAQTGTGKTAAFALPIINALLKSERPRGPKPEFDPDRRPEKKNGRRNGQRGKRPPAFLPRALILSPTRELATQIMDSFREYARHTDLRQMAIFGGVSQFGQEKDLERGVDIIVATPGRLQDLTAQGLMDFSKVETFVLDEADRMLDMGFIQPIREIGEALPTNRQTLLFSATMPPAIAKLASTLLNNPVRVEVPMDKANVPKIKQSVHMVSQEEKQPLLEEMLMRPGVERAVVFMKTKHGADRLSKKLAAMEIDSVSIHGNKTQAQRDRALNAFRQGRSRVLVATDVAARGLDVDGVTHVFNYDLPREPEAYVHRIGRTGRAGATGIAVAFCSPQERGFLRAIEREIGERVPNADGHSAGQGGKPSRGANKPMARREYDDARNTPDRPARAERPARPAPRQQDADMMSAGAKPGPKVGPKGGHRGKRPGGKPAPQPYWYADGAKPAKAKPTTGEAVAAPSGQAAKKKTGYPRPVEGSEPARAGARSAPRKPARGEPGGKPARKPLHRGKGVTPRY